MLTVCCIEQGNYLGHGNEYVASLAAAVGRHLSLRHRIVAFTDRPQLRFAAGGFEMFSLPHPGLTGWFNKLSVFKPGVFADGERVLYIDLDTIIAGSLDEIASYAGEFAMLEDLVFPNQLASGVMAWRGGFGAEIWQSYARAGYPSHDLSGDQGWIMHALKASKVQADCLQDLYPGQIVSYKLSGGVLSPFARVLAFHGRPRPHEISDGWVPHFWGGDRA